MYILTVTFLCAAQTFAITHAIKRLRVIEEIRLTTRIERYVESRYRVSGESGGRIRADRNHDDSLTLSWICEKVEAFARTADRVNTPAMVV